MIMMISRSILTRSTLCYYVAARVILKCLVMRNHGRFVCEFSLNLLHAILAKLQRRHWNCCVLCENLRWGEKAATSNQMRKLSYLINSSCNNIFSLSLFSPFTSASASLSLFPFRILDKSGTCSSECWCPKNYRTCVNQISCRPSFPAHRESTFDILKLLHANRRSSPSIEHWRCTRNERTQSIWDWNRNVRVVLTWSMLWVIWGWLYAVIVFSFVTWWERPNDGEFQIQWWDWVHPKSADDEEKFYIKFTER